MLGRVSWEELLEINLELVLEDIRRPSMIRNIISESRHLPI